MRFKFFFLLCFILTSMLLAQADGSVSKDTTRVLNDQTKQNNSPGILESIFGSTDPDSLSAFYSRRSERKVYRPKPDTIVESKISNFGFGYEYNMFLNTKSHEQGFSVHKIFTDYGIEAFAHYNKSDVEDTSKLFPAANTLLYGLNLLKAEGELHSDPVIDYESRFGLKILSVWHHGSKGLFFASVGFGLKHTTSKIYSRNYSAVYSESAYYIRYSDEKEEKQFTTKAFASLSLGADYNLTENLLVKGELCLFGGNKGQFGPSVALYYWVK